jgi:hypothetical protein
LLGVALCGFEAFAGCMSAAERLIQLTSNKALLLLLLLLLTSVWAQGEKPPAGAISLGGTADASETVSFFVEPSSISELILRLLMLLLLLQLCNTG